MVEAKRDKACASFPIPPAGEWYCRTLTQNPKWNDSKDGGNEGQLGFSRANGLVFYSMLTLYNIWNESFYGKTRMGAGNTVATTLQIMVLD